MQVAGLRVAKRSWRSPYWPFCGKKKPLDEGQVGGSYQALPLMQREPVELGSIAVQDQEADVGLGSLVQNLHQ